MGDIRLRELSIANDDILTTAVLLTVFTPGECRRMVKQGTLFRLWQGVYSTSEPTLASKLAGLDAVFGTQVIPCLDSAAQMWNFDVQQSNTVHIIDPLNRRRNDRSGLVVHQQLDAPLTQLGCRAITPPHGQRSKSRGPRRAREPWQLLTQHCAARTALSPNSPMLLVIRTADEGSG